MYRRHNYRYTLTLGHRHSLYRHYSTVGTMEAGKLFLDIRSFRNVIPRRRLEQGEVENYFRHAATLVITRSNTTRESFGRRAVLQRPFAGYRLLLN